MLILEEGVTFLLYSMFTLINQNTPGSQQQLRDTSPSAAKITYRTVSNIVFSAGNCFCGYGLIYC
jgi:hypothetical protein